MISQLQELSPFQASLMRNSVTIATLLLSLLLLFGTTPQADASPPTVGGVWESVPKGQNVSSSYSFNSNGTGTSALGGNIVTWKFRWKQDGTNITIHQTDGARLTINAKLLQDGKLLRVYSTTSTTSFDDYVKKSEIRLSTDN